MAKVPMQEQPERQTLYTNPATITLGTTSTILLSKSYRGIIYCQTGNSIRNFVIAVYTSTNGAITIDELYKGSNVSFDTSTAYQLKIVESGGSGTINVYDLTFAGEFNV